MQHRAASSRSSVAFGILFTLAAMALSFLAVLAVSGKTQEASAAQAQYNQAAAAETGCANTSEVQTFTGTQDQTTEPFRITGDKFRLAFETQGGGRLEVAVFDETGPTGESFVVRNGDDGSRIVPLGPGTFRLELQENNLRRYSITVEDCLGAAANNNNNTTAVTTAQITNAQATTAQVTTAADDAAADVTASDANEADRSADAFRCDFFLHVVRDDRGALRNQYRGDELIVRRFEQCLSADVIADTIPKRLLPGTGGVSLLGLAVIGLASLAAGAFVLGAALRRRR